MSDLRQKILFNDSGLNTDDNYQFIENGSSPYRLNVMVGEDGSYGVITNLKGNRVITYSEPLVLSNCYFTLGSFYNTLTRKVYFFIFSQPYDSGGGVYLYDNRLLAFNEDTEAIDTIFIDTKNDFGLDPNQILTDMKMVETWLFYNPVTSQPRMIDVDMAYNYTNYDAYDDTDPSFSAVLGDIYTYKGGLFQANTSVSADEDPVNAASKWDRIGDCYQNDSVLSSSEFDRAFFAIKTPPIDRIVATFGSDTTKNFNNVEGIMFRFCHRYQYFDNSFSICSAHSDVTLPVGNEVYNGRVLEDITLHNYITISFGLHSPSLIKKIEVFFQEIGRDWKRMTIINRQDRTLLDSINHTYSFYNNESYPLAPFVKEGVQIPDIIYDAVPKLAGAQEIINKNVLTYAKCTEGFDNIDKDILEVTLTPQIVEISLKGDIDVLKRDNIDNNDWTELSETINGRISPYTRLDVSSWYAAASIADDDIYSVNINSKQVFYTITLSDIASIATFISAISSFLATSYTELHVDSDGATYIDISQRAIRPLITESAFFTPTVTDQLSFTKKGGFKTQAYHPFCLFYYDNALRRADAQLNSDTTVYVPSINDYSPPVTGTNYRWSIDWAISHAPPSWAKYWRWGYAGNSRCSYFEQYIIKDITSGNAEVANSLAIDISPLQTIRTTTETNWNAFPDSTIPQYQFEKGDRIRFITEKTDPTQAGTKLGNTVDGIYDFEIIKYDETTNKLYIQAFTYTTPDFGENTLVEIYTQLKKNEIATYYEFGDIMEIRTDADGNLVHGGQSSDKDQDLGVSPVPATGTFGYGDVYHILRTPSKPLCDVDFNSLHFSVFHESMGWSDFYDSSDWSRGKLGIESAVGEVTRNIIRFSNVFLQNTQVNGITTFEVNNFKELNDTYGDIIGMVEVGNQLKVYQEKKPCSIGIGRTEYSDANGNITIVGSDQVLGVVRYSYTNYGTIFPESIVKNNRYVYGFDAYNGVVWRDAPNGIFPISGRQESTKDAKMMTYFKTKAKAILTSGVSHCNVFSVWDEEYKMLYIVFKDLVDKENNDTVIFHEPSDRWITYSEMDYTPVDGFNEMLELTYSVVKGFENGIGYSFDETTRFATFDIGGGTGTPAGIDINVTKMDITMSLPTPTVTVVNGPTAPTIQAGTTIIATSFYANWLVSATATGYKLDVSTNVGFTSFVGAYEDLDVGNVLTYQVTGLSADTTYYFRVRAYSTVGESVSSLSMATRTSAPPATVVATVATGVGITSMTANWNASSGASGYYLDVATDAGFTSMVSGYNNRDVGNVLLFLVIRLSGATTYYYRVRAYNLHGQTSVSSNTITTPTLPGIPVATAATVVTASGFTTNWNAVSGIDGYYLDVATDSLFTALVSGYNNLDVSNVTTYAVIGLSNDTAYYYRVRSYKGAVSSANSNTITQRTSTPPSTVTATAATSVTATSFYANWDEVTGAAGYYLDVSTDVGFSTFAPGYNNRDVFSVTTYYIRGLVSGTTYYYRVRSYNLKGQISASSNTITVTTT